MPQIIMSKLASGKLDGSDSGAFVNFLRKLGEDDTTSGLHIEPMKNAADRRVRTGRVTDRLRAVLIKMQGPTEAAYIIHGVWDHDEAIRIAKNLRAEVNPINGQVLISEVQTVETPTGIPEPGPVDAGGPAEVAPAATWEPEGEYSWLGSVGHTAKSLYETFGLPPEVGRKALTAQTQNELLDVAGTYPGWVSEVLLGLAAGDSETIIKETLDLMQDVPADTSEDEAILEALTTSVAQSQYAVVEGEEELQRVLEGGSFSDWRKFLHPEQRRYANGRWHGPFRLSGAAGTGKTVVLLHRTKKLVERYRGSSILLTTFTTTLAQGLQEGLEHLDPSLPVAELGEGGITISGVDSVIAHVLRANTAVIAEASKDTLGEARPEMHSRTDGDAWDAAAIRAANSQLPPECQSERFLREEYETVILPQRVTTREEYLRARRAGRGIALNRRRRGEVWEAIEEYRREMQIQGGMSFEEAAAVATCCLEKSGGPLVDHALVDEGQDLSAVKWQFLRALVKEGDDDLFIAEDSQQRIYAPPVVLGHYGIKIVGRSRRLMLSYRTTAQNLQRAVAALEGADYLSLGGTSVQEEKSEDYGESDYRAIRTGPDPVEYTAEGAEYLDVVSSQIGQWLGEGLKPGGIGVLTSDGYVARRVTEHLLAKGIDARQIGRSRGKGNQVQVMTMHRAKGLEFENVVALLPPQRETDIDEERTVMLRCLHYVAMTRARDALAVVSVAAG